MPDITMCSGVGCPIKDECYRHTAVANERQSFFTEPPYGKLNDKERPCEFFWQIEKKSPKKKV